MLQPNAGFRPPEPLDDLTPPLRELDAALLRDGKEMRDSVPAAEPVAARALARIRIPSAETPASIRSERVVREPGELVAGRQTRVRSLQPSRRGFTAVVAMAAVVTLVALVLRAGVARDVLTPHPTPQPSATASPTIAVPSGQWVTVKGLAGNSDPTFSLLDANLVYQVMFTTNLPYVRRSEDGGATWQTLPIPTIAGLAPVGTPGVGLNVYSSPLDVDTVFLVISTPARSSSPADCIAPAAARSSAGGFRLRTSGLSYCEFSYISQDRGAHWQHVTLSDGVVGNLGGDDGLRPISSLHSIVAQGTHLYSYVQAENSPPNYGYFVASDDHGLTWHAIDAAISAQEQSVVDYAAAIDGTTIFAVTNDPFAASAYYLWRSDDAGAHWQHWQLASGGTFTSFGGLAVVPSPSGAEPLIYLVGHVGDGEGNPASATDFYVSRDGGLHWSSAPAGGANGIPAGNYLPTILGILDDGSIVVQTPAVEGSGPVELQFYAWRDGQVAWRTLTPAVLGGVLVAITHSPSTGSQTLWVGTLYTTGSVLGYEFDMQRYTLP